MKTAHLIACALLTVMATSCQKKSGNIWEDNQTGAKYTHRNSAALWGNSSSSSRGENVGSSDEEFLSLNDEDLKRQFSEGSIAQVHSSLGEDGVPPNEAFRTPSGALASIFHPVFFNTDESVLKSRDSLEAIQKMSAYLKEHPKASLVIEGHCDERASESYNQALGAKRANYVRSLFIKNGVAPSQVHTISFGKEKPFVNGHGPDAWAQNRRAHFRIHTQ